MAMPVNPTQKMRTGARFSTVLQMAASASSHRVGLLRLWWALVINPLASHVYPKRHTILFL